jgi:hypothetical protein
VLDARSEKVRHGGQLLDCAILVTALLNEISDAWQTAKIYLNTENHPQPSV